LRNGPMFIWHFWLGTTSGISSLSYDTKLWTTMYIYVFRVLECRQTVLPVSYMYFRQYEQVIKSSTFQISLIINDSTVTISNSCVYSIAADSCFTQITFNFHAYTIFLSSVIFGAFITVKVTRGWRKLHNEELCNLYSSTNMGRKCNMNGRDKNS
jgi:hypothetical protein